MSVKDSNSKHSPDSLKEIPSVDWLDLEQDRDKFLKDLRYALEECGILILRKRHLSKIVLMFEVILCRHRRTLAVAR